MPDDASNLTSAVFDSDAERRVLGQLSIPQRVNEVQAAVQADPNTEVSVHEVGEVLSDLEAKGLAQRLDRPADGASLVHSIEEDPNLPSLHPELAENLLRRLGTTWADRLDGEQWFWTQRGLDALNAPIENEPPPKEGKDLEAAEELNRRLQDEAERHEAEARARKVEELRAEIARLEGADE